MSDRSADVSFAFPRDVLVIGGSAEAVPALTRLVAALDPQLPAAVFVVVHFPPREESVLPAILNRAGALPAAHAVDREPIRHGRIYVAPPDSHLHFSAGRIELRRTARENGFRPAIDPLFKSAARNFGPRVIAVVLSGALSDGAAGLRDVKESGGIAVVQDPTDAENGGMPTAALERVPVDHVVPLATMGSLLSGLVRPLADHSERDMLHAGKRRGCSAAEHRGGFARGVETPAQRSERIEAQ